MQFSPLFRRQTQKLYELHANRITSARNCSAIFRKDQALPPPLPWQESQLNDSFSRATVCIGRHKNKRLIENWNEFSASLRLIISWIALSPIECVSSVRSNRAGYIRLEIECTAANLISNTVRKFGLLVRGSRGEETFSGRKGGETFSRANSSRTKKIFSPEAPEIRQRARQWCTTFAVRCTTFACFPGLKMLWNSLTNCTQRHTQKDSPRRPWLLLGSRGSIDRAIN